MQDDYDIIKAVESQIRRKTYSYGEVGLSRKDHDLFRDALYYGYTLLMDLLPDDFQLAQRHYRGLLGGRIDILTLAKSLKFMDQLLKQSFQRIRLGDHWDVPRFKHEVHRAGLQYGWMKPVECKLHLFLAEQDISAFRILNTWINFLGRINFRSLDLTESLESEYIAFEEEMLDWSYESTLLQDLNKVMQEWLAGFTFEEYKPSHGPGSVAEVDGKQTHAVKHTLHHVDNRLLYFFKRDVPYDWKLDFPFEDIPIFDKPRVSTLVCVPKTILKNRTISKEPVTLQYAQQGVRHALDVFMHTHKDLSRRINLHDQSLSKDKAREASRFGELATIDLSNASDSVSYSLIKRIFRGTPLYRALICTRSDYTKLPSGRILRLEKFAPMGSALCFPIECLVFAAVCEVARRRTGRRLYYRVYGDDIICSEEMSEQVIALLNQCHFTVNQDKSFSDYGVLNFRESCGGEYVNGIDVSPFRLSRKYVPYDQSKEQLITSAEVVSSYISLANTAFEYGFLHTRRAILERLSARFSRFDRLVFSDDDTRLRTFYQYLTNYKCEHRFLLSRSRFSRQVMRMTNDKKIMYSPIGDTVYQRVEVSGCQFVTKRDDKAGAVQKRDFPRSFLFYEEIRYFAYWQQRRQSDVYKPDSFGIVICPEPVDFSPSKVKVLWKWIYV